MRGTNPTKTPYGLYIHIPYCRSRCRYCDFYSLPLGGNALGDGQVPDAYVQALLRALPRFAPRDAAGKPLRPSTLYFGGGTPSLLSPAQLEEIIHAADPLPGAEVTLEANPGTASAEKLAAFKNAGANRLSLGVQSARDDSLRLLGRPHTAKDARQALGDAEKAGFGNISGDIMLALPGYTRHEFDETLALLKEGGASHISAYLLKLEPGTPLAQDPPTHLPGPDEAADFYLYACERLEAAGYRQYEISNFARDGRESRHNLLYWECENWLGLGPGAHSCLGGRRFSFPPDTAAFTAGASIHEEGALGADDFIMLRLRLISGLPEEELFSRYGIHLSQKQKKLLSSLESAGLATHKNGNHALTPRGMLVQNSILSQLLE